MKKLIILYLILINSFQSNAIQINEKVFIENGGNIDDISSTFEYAFDPLRQESYSEKYLSFGKIKGSRSLDCGAIWLGDDNKQWTYILTISSCFFNISDEKTPISGASFISWDNETIAEGEGFVFLPKERMDMPDRHIAIVALPKVDVVRDINNMPIQKPILYTGEDELNNSNSTVDFVGYGLWRVGAANAKDYQPADDNRRLWGQSVVDGLTDSDFSLSAGYEPLGVTRSWAKAAKLEKGMVWWQYIQGHHVISALGLESRSDATTSTGSRVSKYTQWIKSIYPDASFFHSEFMHWDKNDSKASIGEIYQYNNPYNGDFELFKLIGLDSDGRYGVFPTDKENNGYWEYFGPHQWGEHGNIDDIFQKSGVDNTKELYTLIRLNLLGTYGAFPPNKEDNLYWSHLKTEHVNDDGSVMYKPAKVEFAMVPCQGPRRCGKARVTIDQVSYKELGSPVYGQFRYSKNHQLSQATSRGFKYDAVEQIYWIAQTMISEWTTYDYYVTLDKVCFSDDNQGNKLSCAESVLTVDPYLNLTSDSDSDEFTYSILKFAIPPTAEEIHEETVPVAVGVRSVSLPMGKFKFVRIKIKMDKLSYLKLHSPDIVRYDWHRGKDTDMISSKFVPNSEGNYYFEKTDQVSTVWAKDRYSYTLDEVCLKDDDNESESDFVENRCVKADDLTDGSYFGGYQKQILHFPIPIVSE